MAHIKPFKCIRPAEDKASKIAALPYDVYSSEEAKAKVHGDAYTFLRIDRAETQFEEKIAVDDPRVYDKARQILDNMIENGDFISDGEDKYYIYELTMNGRTQTGIVACASIDDYCNNVIKKHENTREDKELDRIRHVDVCNAQTGPIFLAYRSKAEINEVVNKTKNNKAVYDFVSDDGIRHRVWDIALAEDIQTIRDGFEAIENIYIADGHHRAASAVKVGLKRRKEQPEFMELTGEEEFNFFLSVLFPDEELMIMDYNRVVKDLNGYSLEQFMDKVKENFDVECEGESQVVPSKKGEMGMFVDGKWYRINAKTDSMILDDPVKKLDVAILQDYLLGPVLGIEDPRTDNRIAFIGGIRGLGELERRVNSDMKVAFAMYPTSIGELFDVADKNMLMPPKSTWFEPKLRSGLFIHSL
ncbi:MAG: DUF1015 domain-containing protein [Lachnospiraceae bacterium]|nr:DUF1015 domain-containing protein [Lachnospiraceae bacterium]